jgi:hypothetical protein
VNNSFNETHSCCEPQRHDAAATRVASRKSCTLPTQAAISVFGRQHIDVLVSNAAVNPAGGPILQMEDHVIDKILQVIGAWLLLCCASKASCVCCKAPNPSCCDADQRAQRHLGHTGSSQAHEKGETVASADRERIGFHLWRHDH